MNDIEQHALELIGENVDSPDVFTDTESGIAQIRDSINDAIEEICMLSGCNKISVLVPLMADANFYNISAMGKRVLWIDNAWVIGTNRKLARVDIKWMENYNPRWLEHTGNPERYFLVGLDTLCVHPRPAASTGVVELIAAYASDRYDKGTDRIVLLENFKWAAAHFAAGEFYASRGDARTALYHHEQYLKRAGTAAMYQEMPQRSWAAKTVKADYTGSRNTSELGGP